MSTAIFVTDPGLAALPGLRHGFFTRRGGVSGAPYASLNCSLSGKDDVAAVRENRGRAMAALGLPPAALHGLFQVHGVAVAVLGEDPWAEDGRPEADGVVTRRRGLALGIVTADCAPVLFADAEAGVIGACHAGWRGAVAGVMEATIAAMAGLGAAPGRIRAAIGPCIGQASYEVGPDLREAVLGAGTEGARFFAPGRSAERWQFDLPGYCAARLARLGLGAVAATGRDTLAEAQDFFSYRRQTLAGGGPVGHQLSAIALAG